MITIAVLGGSGASTPELARVLGRSPLAGGGLRLLLVGRSEEKLQAVGGAAAALAGDLVRVETATEVGRGVAGADFIVNQIRVGGLRARAFDETFPREFGIPGEETLGPGGFANALRTLPVVLEQAKVIEREAPGAWVVNLTNPAGMVQQAFERATSLKVISVCDSPVTLIEQAVGAAGGGAADYVGMNHVGWVCGLQDRTGADLMPRVFDALQSSGLQPAGRLSSPVDVALIQRTGCLPAPYLRYYYHPDRMLTAQRNRRPRAEELMELEGELLSAYRGGVSNSPEALTRRGAVWYEKATLPALEALAGLGRREMVVCGGNHGCLPWLPASAAIEVPTLVAAGGPGRRRAGELPPDARGLLARHAAFEQLTVEGVLEGDEGKLLRALVANPLVPSYDVAVRVLNRAREGIAG